MSLPLLAPALPDEPPVSRAGVTVPRHVAIIMDGRRRATCRAWPDTVPARRRSGVP